MNRRSQGYEPCEIPLLYPAIYVSFQHICTGSPQADCFLHLGQHPHILFILQNSGRRWSRTIRTTMATDLQSAPLPLRNILPEPGRTGLAIGLSCYAFHYPVFFICGTHTGNPGGFLITVVCSTSIFMHNFNGLWFASFENSFNQRALR